MSTTATIERVEPATAHQWLQAGDAVLIDVRERDEHAREHIPGAMLMPLSTFDPTAVPSGKRIVLHCRSGTRSMEAATQIAACGHTVYSVEGGIEAWRERELPTKINRTAPLPIMRQVQITAGSLVVLGTALGFAVSPWWLVLSGFVGAGLVFAGLSGFCGMAHVLAVMPWNQRHAK